MSAIKFILGYIKSLLNPRISCLAFISSDNQINSKAKIYRGVKIKKSSVGAYSYVGPWTDVENARIGHFCSISDHCRIGMGGHNIRLVSTSPIFTEKNNGTKISWVGDDVKAYPENTVYLGNDVLVGSHALIYGGVHVGDGAVVCAGAVVTKDVPPYAVVGGVPAKVIKYRFSRDIIESLLDIQWWNWSEDSLRRNIGFFQKDNLTLEDVRQYCNDN